ncbi:MAG: hypothetical protein MRJ65_17545 [Candidatus Brocadiaceae bacterium]|nr:hypothetical protein [Candidatus Brocadiaceae bacterium]
MVYLQKQKRDFSGNCMRAMFFVVIFFFMGCAIRKQDDILIAEQIAAPLEPIVERKAVADKSEIEQKALAVTPETEQKTASVKSETRGKEVIDKNETEFTEESLRCINCHTKRGVVHGFIEGWKKSTHAMKGVGCEVCHVSTDDDVSVKEAIEQEYLTVAGSECEDGRVNRQVVADICGRCHRKQHEQFLKSSHATSWNKISDQEEEGEVFRERRSIVCAKCHSIQYKCDACHTRHSFHIAHEKSPEICNPCHMGSDHPYYEMYSSSKHGALYAAKKSGSEQLSQIKHAPETPVCVTCHMPEGSHDVSFGLVNDVGLGKVEASKRRDAMESVCNACHTRNFVRKAFHQADSNRGNVENVLDEALDIILRLEKEGVIVPPFIEKREKQLPGHPITLSDSSFHMATSEIERIFSRLYAYSASVTKKAAYHMSFDYMFTHGWVKLQEDMNRLREEAERLQKEADLKKKLKTKLR